MADTEEWTGRQRKFFIDGGYEREIFQAWKEFTGDRDRGYNFFTSLFGFDPTENPEESKPFFVSYEGM